MSSIERNLVRPASQPGDTRHRDVIARLMEVTRRYCGTARPAAKPAVCDGAGFEDRLQESLAALSRADRRACAGQRLPGRAHDAHEQAPASLAWDAEGGILAWIELDGLHTYPPAVAGQAADELRDLVRERIRTCAGARDGTLGRYGAESFAWMLPSPLPLEQAVALAEAMLEAMSAPCRIAGVPSTPLPSLGIVYFPQDGTNPAMLLMRACAAMRRARHYRMGYAFYSPILDAAFATPIGVSGRMSQNAARRSFVARSVTA